MQTPESVRGWFEAQAAPVAILCGVVGTGLLLLAVFAWMNHKRLARNRAGEGIDSFLERMSVHGLDPHLCRLAYAYLQERIGVDYPVLPKDLLDEDLGMTDSEVDEMVSWLLIASSRNYEPGSTPGCILTVADVVRHVQGSQMQDRLAA